MFPPPYITGRNTVDTDGLQLNAEWLFIIRGKVSFFSGGTISWVISVVVADCKRAESYAVIPHSSQLLHTIFTITCGLAFNHTKKYILSQTGNVECYIARSATP